jgi:hypothetical protein
MTISSEDIAGAIAFFQQSRDKALLQEVLRKIRPRAAAAVRRYQERGTQIPPPQDVAPAAVTAAKEAALRTVEADLDFGQLQAVSRAVGQRLESLMAAEHQGPEA